MLVPVGEIDRYAIENLELGEAQSVVNSYGRAAIARTSMLGKLSDLPHPKTHIKQALLVVLRATRDPWLRKSLTSAYVSLADWYEAAEYPALAASAAASSCNLSTARAAEAQRKSVLKQVIAEAARLSAELKALGI